ncbi:MAG: polynucleotide adenylyltransferase PcnB [Lentisphaerae bacterium]|nr:polynucleotide adenylyltransferase PcnB [Lentisphaerota bacterium]
MTPPDPVDAVRVVRERGEHNVSRKHMDEDALKVLYRLMRNGFIAYLVGGGVRDLLLGRQPKDFDVATNAHPRQIRKLFRNSFLIGRRFRLVHVRFGAKVIEVSTFRRQPEEAPVPEGTEPTEPDSLYQDSDNTFGTPEEDAWRRDFTINALFYDIRTYAIIDHVGGLNDLEARLIRTIGNPDERFQEDPVRMVRAVRFAARLGFHIERETYAAIIRHHEQIGLAAPPRLLEEVYKLFPFGSGEAAFRQLRRTRLLAVLFPELDSFLDSAGHEVAMFWKHLAGIDRGVLEGSGQPDPALLFATMFYAPFLDVLRAEQRQDDVVRHPAMARALFEPVAMRYRMPKRVFYRTIQLLDGQRRFEGPGKRFSRRFAGHEIFGDMIALRRIHLQATGGDLTTLDPWIALRAEALRDQPHDQPHEGRRGGRPRWRRGRGRPDGERAGPDAGPETGEPDYESLPSPEQDL